LLRGDGRCSLLVRCRGFDFFVPVRDLLSSVMLTNPLARLRLIGLLEGLSFLVLLLIAMPLKYAADQPLAVRYVGMAHGVLFLLYLLALLPVALDYRWSWRTGALAVLASLLPGGPFVFDHRVLKPLAARPPV
jgi:integral membrane protein